MWVRKRHPSNRQRFGKWHTVAYHGTIYNHAGGSDVRLLFFECGNRAYSAEVKEHSETTPPEPDCCQVCWRRMAVEATPMTTGV